MSAVSWTLDDATSFREFLRRVPKEQICAVMRAACPAVVDVETALKNSADAVARVAAMRAGWDAYEKALFELAETQKRPVIDAEYRDMS